MSRRGRAVAFLLLAVVAAAIAAAVANGYGSSVARGYGALRPVVVVAADLPAGETIGPNRLASTLAVRRVPVRFVPPGTLTVPGDALGLAPRMKLPAGSYLLAEFLRPPGGRQARPVGLRGNRRPVEIAVSGAGALFAAGGNPSGVQVDVAVTEEPVDSGSGRTYIAAASVPLIALSPGPDGPGPGGLANATLGLTRRQALRLIAAQNFARQVTLLPEG